MNEGLCTYWFGKISRIFIYKKDSQDSSFILLPVKLCIKEQWKDMQEQIKVVIAGWE